MSLPAPRPALGAMTIVSPSAHPSQASTSIVSHAAQSAARSVHGVTGAPCDSHAPRISIVPSRRQARARASFFQSIRLR